MSYLRRYSALACAAATLLPLVAVASQSADAKAPTTKTVRVYAWADTYSNSAHPKTAYGHSKDLRIGSGYGTSKVAYLRFSIPTSTAKNVVAARLVLTRTSHHLPTTTITATRVTTNWTERHLTQRTAPKVGRSYASVRVSKSARTVSINVTSAVKGRRAIAVALRASARHDIASFRSREARTGIPTLVLTVRLPAPQPKPASTTSPTPPKATPPDPTQTAPVPDPTTSAAPTPTPSTDPTTSAPTPSPSTDPTTSAPTPTPSTDPTTSAPTPSPSPTAPPCSVSALLVPSCNVWFGDTPQAYTHTCFPLSKCLAIDESFTQRKFDLVHLYKVNGAIFPDKDAIALADQGRTLSINWKPGTDMTWADVAAGKADSRIDAEAAYLKANFNRKFFLTIYHEPEDNVIATPGSGMTVADYVAMYRHTIKRLRADGADMFVTVMNYMGYYRWDSIRDALYPGDDVVDWIAWDPYMYNPSNQPGYDFAGLVNTAHGSQPGMYDWATTRHPGKPLMLAEYGAFDQGLSAAPFGPSQFYPTITAQLPKFPALKALIHFTMNPIDVAAGQGTSPTETSAGLAAWRTVAQNPMFDASRSR